MRATWLLVLAIAACHAPRQPTTPADRVRALRDAAHACLQKNQPECARERLERAIEPEVPGASEAAMFELGELIEKSDRARALNLYYRAAAGAEHNLGRGWPWKAATDRILQLSMSR